MRSAVFGERFAIVRLQAPSSAASTRLALTYSTSTVWRQDWQLLSAYPGEPVSHSRYALTLTLSQGEREVTV
jgi:hypothetical protein